MRAPKKAPKRTPRKRARVCWIKFHNGEEFVARVREAAGGYEVSDALVISYVSGIMALSPYGMLADDATFSAKRDTVFHCLDVSDAVLELYESSVKQVPLCMAAFEALIRTSTHVASGPHELVVQMDPDTEMTISGPETVTDAQMRETLGHPPEFEPKRDGRSRKQLIDNLTDLADKAGKGKKKRVDAD